MKKRKDPIKALELLRDWNKECAEDLSKLMLNDPDYAPKKWTVQIFEQQAEFLTIIIEEMKK